MGFAASRYFTFRDTDLLEEFIPSNAVLGLKGDFSIAVPGEKMEDIKISPVVDLILQKTRPARLNWGFTFVLEQRPRTEIKLMLGQRGFFLEGGPNITRHEMNDVTRRLNFGLGLKVSLKKLSWYLDGCWGLANRYGFNRTFVTMGLSW